MMSAPPVSRATTAAVGLQPASIRDLPRAPAIPKVKADATAKIMPVRKWPAAVPFDKVTGHLR